jgi:hypothetical protein
MTLGSFPGLALALLTLAADVGTLDAQPTQEPWTPAQAARIVERLGAREPFIGSPETRRHSESLGRFFRQEDYETLRGNPVYGYWSESGFRWTGVRVAWDGIVAASPSSRPIRRRAWDAAFAYVARKHGLTVDRRAPVRVRGACVAAVIEPSLEEPNRGVVMEIRIDSPSGPFRYRFGMGKPTLEDAVGASLDWAVSFAMTVNRGRRAVGGGPH